MTTATPGTILKWNTFVLANPNIDFTNAKYTGIQSPVILRCKKHDFVFTKLAGAAVKCGVVCPKCMSEIRVDRLRISRNEQAREKWYAMLDAKYDDLDFTEAVYVDTLTKVRVTCLRDGTTFSTTPASFKRGRCCPTCANKSRSEHGKKAGMSAAMASATASNKLGGIESWKNTVVARSAELDLSKAVYEGTHIKVEAVCVKVGHIFKTTPASLKQGFGCPVCNRESMVSDGRTTWEQYLTSRTDVDFSESKYEGAFTKVTVRCVKHNTFFTTLPTNFRKGQGCPTCAAGMKSSNGEKELNGYGVK
jgi:Zn finger protein HypA/HybF involved in hydrogenase expression